VPYHLRHRHALGRLQDFGIDIEVALGPAVAAVHLQQLSLPDEVTDRYRLEAQRRRPAAAASPVPITLELDQLGKPRDQLGDASSLVIGQTGVGDRDCAVSLAVDMRKNHAISIDDGCPLGINSTSMLWESGARACPRVAELVADGNGDWLTGRF
jgi:hypothetical protein